MPSSSALGQVAWEVVFASCAQAEAWFGCWAEQGQLQPGQRDDCVRLLRGRWQALRSVAEQGGEVLVLPGMLPLQTEETPWVGEFRVAGGICTRRWAGAGVFPQAFAGAGGAGA